MAAPRVDPFEVRGELSVRDSATVICVRRRTGGALLGEREQGFSERFEQKFGRTRQPFLRYLLRARNFEFNSGWEVLLGQSEVVNWLRSEPSKISVMRYAGEFKLAGGNVDEGESLDQAARRELHEEFLRPAETHVPASDVVLRPFSVKQTRPIRSRSNLMYNFVALADENPWLRNLDVDEINLALKRRREAFLAFISDPNCPYFSFTDRAKEDISPEVYQLRWVPLEEAVENCLTSTLENVYVNEWQEREFSRLGRVRRDPLIMTGAVLVELEQFPTSEALLEYCQSVSFEDLCKAEQWLFQGMTAEEVKAALDARLAGGSNPSFLHLDEVARRRGLAVMRASLVVGGGASSRAAKSNEQAERGDYPPRL